MIWPTPSSTGSSTMLTDCNSLVTVCASKTGPKPSPLDPMQPVMERSHPTSGRPATPADINRNGRPTSIGTSGRHQSECPADIIGMRRRMTAKVNFAPWHALQVWLEQDGVRSAIVPYAEKIAAAIPPLNNRLRRDFEAILKLIQTHAILHQVQREHDDQGRVIATVDDYAVVYELVADLIGVAVEAGISN